MSDDYQHTRTPGAARSARQLVGRGLGRCGLYGLALATAGLAACSATASPAPQDLGRPAASSTVGAPAGRAASSPAVPDLTFVYTGHSEEVGVPASATAAYVTVGGGAGWTHSNFDAREPGRGVILTGTLDVTAGDTLTVAVGGQGTEEKTNKRPGVGGWSIPHYAGGSGGSGHGSQTYDGAGGGGASVIQRNGTTVVVAAGGGGEGGSVERDGFVGGNFGGAGGGSAGSDGVGGSTGTAGRGGSSARPDQDSRGGSHTGSGIQGGGGGGGGGYFAGGGGKASLGGVFTGGGGGGGGSSLSSSLAGATVYTGADGTRGDGTIEITWLYSPASGSAWTFTKVGAPTPQALDGQAPSDRPPSAAVTTHALAYRQDGTVSAQQVWTYTIGQGKVAGQLVNLQTGLCLEVNGNSGALDQWPCEAASANHQWRLLLRKDGVVTLRVDLPSGDTPLAAGSYYLATTKPSNKTAGGSLLTLVKDGLDDKTTWAAALQRS